MHIVLFTIAGGLELSREVHRLVRDWRISQEKVIILNRAMFRRDLDPSLAFRWALWSILTGNLCDILLLTDSHLTAAKRRATTEWITEFRPEAIVLSLTLFGAETNSDWEPVQEDELGFTTRLSVHLSSWQKIQAYLFTLSPPSIPARRSEESILQIASRFGIPWPCPGAALARYLTEWARTHLQRGPLQPAFDGIVQDMNRLMIAALPVPRSRTNACIPINQVLRKVQHGQPVQVLLRLGLEEKLMIDRARFKALLSRDRVPIQIESLRSFVISSLQGEWWQMVSALAICLGSRQGELLKTAAFSVHSPDQVCVRDRNARKIVRPVLFLSAPVAVQAVHRLRSGLHKWARKHHYQTPFLAESGELHPAALNLVKKWAPSRLPVDAVAARHRGTRHISSQGRAIWACVAATLFAPHSARLSYMAEKLGHVGPPITSLHYDRYILLDPEKYRAIEWDNTPP